MTTGPTNIGDPIPEVPAHYPDYRRVKGPCPACRNETLFLGDGGHVTCSWIECPNPGAAGDVFDRVQEIHGVSVFVENLEALIRAFRQAQT